MKIKVFCSFVLIKITIVKNMTLCNEIRDTVSMSAVSATVPTVFESVCASTHGFWQFFSYFPLFHIRQGPRFEKKPTRSTYQRVR